MISQTSLNKRVLYKVLGEAEVHEAAVQEFSPTAKYVRLNYQWHTALEVEVVEELAPLAASDLRGVPIAIATSEPAGAALN